MPRRSGPARIRGFATNVSTLTGQAETTQLPAPKSKREIVVEADEPTSAMPVTKAMWQTLNLKERVLNSGLISVQEIAEVLGISLTHARNLAKEVKGEAPHVHGRSGVPYQALIDGL